jgi:hypothetical protein
MVVNIDTAASGEHCRVEMDKDTGRFYLCDGTSKKSSKQLFHIIKNILLTINKSLYLI